ncbi:hypothetical protein PRIPAC_78105 [Pristionchus pacificus]|uniref:Uncharacterized protein n=1 Tax=Pristionchus pacificus TaxID=54126 RepID=A0A2A6BY70_PRIPA|nr:hypothetical protein PRIPAC_78105 [Pristionchus pacificus]|eukprot:PDM70796.1 hypothetical protein PRIPAC_45000 [Pristionchus pacificus]
MSSPNSASSVPYYVDSEYQITSSPQIQSSPQWNGTVSDHPWYNSDMDSNYFGEMLTDMGDRAGAFN